MPDEAEVRDRALWLISQGRARIAEGVHFIQQGEQLLMGSLKGEVADVITANGSLRLPPLAIRGSAGVSRFSMESLRNVSKPLPQNQQQVVDAAVRLRDEGRAVVRAKDLLLAAGLKAVDSATLTSLVGKGWLTRREGGVYELAE